MVNNQLIQFIFGILVRFLGMLSSFLRKDKSKQIKEIIEILKSDQISNNIKLDSQKKLDDLIYDKVYGIDANPFLRNSIEKLVKESQGEITHLTVKKALPYLKHNKEGLQIKVEKFDVFSQKMFFVMFFVLGIFMIMLLIFTFICLYYYSYTLEFNFRNLALCGLVIVFFLSLGFINSCFLEDYQSTQSAIKIIDYFHNNKEYTTIPYKVLGCFKDKC